jgi:hypothetical protein
MNTITKSLLLVLLCSTFLVFTSCEFSFSTGSSKKAENLSKKLSLKENGLKANNIVLNDGRKEITSSTLAYGTELNFDFGEVSGFTEVDEFVYPGLGMIILNVDKDTLIQNKDLYEGKFDSIKAQDLDLTAYVTLGDPISSGGNYTIKLHVWDKKGTGTLDASLDIKLVPNEHIKVESEGLEYSEIFLYSDKREVITDNQVVLNENIYFVFDDLEGFKGSDGKVNLGASIEARNSFGMELLKKDDVFAGQSIIPVESLKEGVAPYILFNEKEDKEPLKIKCKVRVWDKRSDKSITIYTNLVLVDELDW